MMQKPLPFLLGPIYSVLSYFKIAEIGFQGGGYIRIPLGMISDLSAKNIIKYITDFLPPWERRSPDSQS